MVDICPDLALLKLFMVRENYEKYIDYVRKDLLEFEIRILLDDFGAYYEATTGDSINLDEFPTWFHHYRHPDIAESKHQMFKYIFKSLQNYESEVADVVLERFKEQAALTAIRKSTESKLNLDELKGILTSFEKTALTPLEEEDKNWIKNDLQLLLEQTEPTAGLQWRLNCLNESIGPLNKGKLIIVAAYVDVGKTMFAISEATYMAQQLEKGCVLWLNNEEDDARVYKKIWKSVLGCTESDLYAHKDKAIKEYTKRMHGDIERIKFIDIRSKSLKEISALFEKYKPSLAILDQVDKINNKIYKAFSDYDRLKNLYGEVRTLANKYCPIIAVSQADSSTVRIDQNSGNMSYLLYPHHRQLDGSKVGKPGEADAIIMIGRRNETNNTRGIHVSKNKFGDVIKKEVIFSGERARYENP